MMQNLMMKRKKKKGSLAKEGFSQEDELLEDNQKLKDSDLIFNMIKI